MLYGVIKFLEELMFWLILLRLTKLLRDSNDCVLFKLFTDLWLVLVFGSSDLGDSSDFLSSVRKPSFDLLNTLTPSRVCFDRSFTSAVVTVLVYISCLNGSNPRLFFSALKDTFNYRFL